ncbi:N-succinyldiaminopimelate aminotransferase [Motilibacter rhizosphaerae]|uniref:N-succinyldiaminopimelate aminotransferase n=1 Tax=Motilibacter rhizosphaerae TaxID=598652 RepID=A0A4V2F4Y7_9ACTN|nr:pyridoxal phosphate-dependent aminotransferase [Motilibacter rhizosphaerae]RZS90959.1 N-succinyldiaminopimelate aminotransferase [Motilibacter rhizosphaerae]
MHAPARRVQGLGTTIFAEMTALAVETGSVNLGQGFPDTDGPVEMVAAAAEALQGGQNQYPPGPGILPLREAVAEHQQRCYGLVWDPADEVLITTGATEAVAAALLAFVEPGDEVVALEPFYDSYAACVQLAGGRLVPVTLRAPDFRLDVDALRTAVTEKTKLLLVNSPHNPTGTVLTRAELEAVAALAVERDLLVVTDEVYEHLVYDDAEHVPLATLPGMRERTVSISSAGKTFSFTGWKIGWVTAAPELVAAVRSAKQFLTYVSGAPFQPAVATGLRLGSAPLEQVRLDLQRKRDLLCDGLEALGLQTFRPQGTYFATTDIAGLALGDGVEFCRTLPRKLGVVAIPSSVFYAEPERGRTLVRWAFCKRDEVLEEALRRLAPLAP